MPQQQSSADLAKQYGGAQVEDLAKQFGGTPVEPESSQPAQPEQQSAMDHLWTTIKTIGSDLNPLNFAEAVHQTSLKYPGIGGPEAIIGTMLQPNVDQAKKAISLAKQGRYVEAAGHGEAAAIPVAGPMIANIGESLAEGKGDEAVGHALAIGIGAATPEKIAEALPAVKAAMAARGKPAPSLGEFTSDTVKAIPPSSSAPYSPADIKRAHPYLVSEHNTSPINSVESLRDAADSAITQIEEKVGSYVRAYPKDLIQKAPLDAARAALSKGVRKSDMSAGMKELDDLGLDEPVTVERGDAIRLRLNAENKAVLSRNNYDVDTARKVDPAFAAREVAARELRDGVYQQLDARGIPGVDELRRDEGSIIKLRDAAQRHVYNSARAVAGTGSDTLKAKIVRKAIPAGTGAVGAATGGVIGGPVGATIGGGAGAAIGVDLAKKMAPANLTRDALVERAFSKTTAQAPKYPKIPAAPVEQKALPPAPRISHVPDTSYVRGVPAQAPFNPPRFTLPAHEPGIPLGPKPDTSGLKVIEARGTVVRDPKTGRFKRIYTTEGK